MTLKFSIILFSFLLAFPITHSYSLADLPRPFLNEAKPNGIFVVGNNTADLVSLSLINVELRKTYNPVPPLGHLRDYSFFSPISEWSYDANEVSLDQNIISIGGPCSNKITAKIMGVSSEWPECAVEFGGSFSRIIIYNKWNFTQLIIAGYTSDDTFQTAGQAALNRNLRGLEVRDGMLFLSDEEKQCTTDYDCALSKDGCCHNKFVAINKKFKGIYEGDCTNIACTSIFYPRTLFEAKCVSNRCTGI